MSSTLTAATLRNLGQKEYDKRKQAALEVENLARELRDASEFEKVAGLIQTLSTDLAESPLANLRKGALHALAGTAIGLGPANVTAVLPALLSPVLACFQDQDPRVRYYGCEALYNIAKVARGDSVAHFNAIFDGLFKLSADTDISVQNGMQLVDRLMKDIVAESENFDVDGFMPLLRERVYVTNPFSRQFLVGWISALDSVPDMEMLTHLPVFFDGLFHMLADPNKEIRQQTYSVLSEFLREIREVETIKYAPAVQVLVQHSGSQDKFTRLTAITWLHAFVQQGRDQLLPFCAQVLNAVLASLSHAEDEIREAAQKADAALRQLLQESADSSYEVHTLLHALGGHLGSQYVPTLLASLQWVHMLLKKSAPRVMQVTTRPPRLCRLRLLHTTINSTTSEPPPLHPARDAAIAADLARPLRVPLQPVGRGRPPRHRGAREDGAERAAVRSVHRPPPPPLPTRARAPREARRAGGAPAVRAPPPSPRLRHAVAGAPVGRRPRVRLSDGSDAQPHPPRHQRVPRAPRDAEAGVDRRRRLRALPNPVPGVVAQPRLAPLDLPPL